MNILSFRNNSPIEDIKRLVLMNTLKLGVSACVDFLSEGEYDTLYVISDSGYTPEQIDKLNSFGSDLLVYCIIESSHKIPEGLNIDYIEFSGANYDTYLKYHDIHDVDSSSVRYNEYSAQLGLWGYGMCNIPIAQGSVAREHTFVHWGTPDKRYASTHGCDP